jgi:hypothetical protein
MPSRIAGMRAAASVSGKTYQNRAQWMPKFLSALAETSNVSAAADRAGVTSAHVYKLRRDEPEFARQWQGALCEGYDNLEFELLDRLRNGIVSDGEGRKFDNAAALRLLTAHRESVSRERALRDNENAAEVIASIDAKLDRMRERAMAAGQDVWGMPGDDDGPGNEAGDGPSNEAGEDRRGDG